MQGTDSEIRDDGKYRDGTKEMTKRMVDVYRWIQEKEREEIVTQTGLVDPGMLEVNDSTLRLDIPSDPVLKAEYYLTAPIFHQLVNRFLDASDESPATVKQFCRRNTETIELDVGVTRSPPYTTSFDWADAFDYQPNIPELPEKSPSEWRFQYQNKIHLTYWRLTHLPTGWESPTLSRWEKDGENTYLGHRGDFSYKIEIHPERTRVATSHTENSAAVSELTSDRNVTDGNPYEEFEWATDPVSPPKVEELREAYLNGELTESQFEHQLEQARDFDEVVLGQEFQEDETETKALSGRVKNLLGLSS